MIHDDMYSNSIDPRHDISITSVHAMVRKMLPLVVRNNPHLKVNDLQAPPMFSCLSAGSGIFVQLIKPNTSSRATAVAGSNCERTRRIRPQRAGEEDARLIRS